MDLSVRAELLRLTGSGRALFDGLAEQAVAFDRALRKSLGAEQAQALEMMLRQLAAEE